MAVDKNFVVKNGIEVNSNLIIADANTKKVGIGSTGPRTTLDVRGGIAATDGNFSGIVTATTLNVEDYGAINGTSVNVTGFSTLGGISVDQLTVTGFTTFTDISLDEVNARNINVTGIATVPVFVGLTSFKDLNVSGMTTLTDVNATGIITATAFSGDGSGLIGVASTDNIQTSTPANFLSDVNISGMTTLTDVNSTGIITATAFSGDGSGLTGVATTTTFLVVGRTTNTSVPISSGTFTIEGRGGDVVVPI